MDDIRLYEDRRESFGQKFALSGANTMRPDAWWKISGVSATVLQQVAI
ncbi:hypothetical protein M5689_006725 [Euphorbia peplus]|nr:hypothetical protein M5689_006725 [Euphorbia peplus]